MRIEAAVLRAADAPYSVEAVDLAEPGPGEVLVRIAGTGMCHTDLLGRAPGDRIAKPVILGHEGSGVIEAVGPGVVSLRAGQHVVLSFDSCGGCAECRGSRPTACSRMTALNMRGTPADGVVRARDERGTAVNNRWFGQSSFATHALATVANTVPVADDLPLELLGPLGCGVQTGAGAMLISLGVGVGDSVAIFGAGAVGLAAVMAAKAAGATTIVAVDLNEARRDLALELGATHALDGADPDLTRRIRRLGGEGVRCSFDTTAVPAIVAAAVGCLRAGGVCGLAGVGSAEYRLDPMVLLGRTVKGIIVGDAVPQVFVPRLIELWRLGRFPFDRLIRTYPLTSVNEAEADAVEGKVVKPVLIP
ncbi:NAD(P)-dependent alcohol dehydrogenase [Actinocorallia longicatena]|uniref:NAD(P)-dependent alcohol dehydrogenase n=1 Tax=Actinocorallia longicatena TaxID=111803 RepID=A0ABP6Q8D4_9ACTN